MELRLVAIEGLPEIGSEDSIALLLTESFDFQAQDVLVLAQKIISKAEGRTRDLNEVVASTAARRIALLAEKDERLVQLILDESRRVLRVRRGVIIVEDRRGWVCANAGIDRSNVVQARGQERVCLLPLDPDASAAAVRNEIEAMAGVAIGVIISDSHGRAWRQGTVGVAIGAAGITALCDRRGRRDRHGYVLQHTLMGTADELAAAASLLMGQADEGLPAVVIRGVDVRGQDNAKGLQRPAETDLFR